MSLQNQNNFEASDIESLKFGRFHESVRLATANPSTTEEAQYSLPFPVATALIHKQLTVAEVDGEGLQDKSVHQLSRSIELYEVDAYNDVFPERRISEVCITLKDGRTFDSGPTEANGDPEIPLDEETIDNKFDLFASPALGETHTIRLREHVRNMGDAADLSKFSSLIYTAEKPFEH